MPSTYLYTNTYTYTQTDAVVDQFSIALDYAEGILNETETERLLVAVRRRQISAMGIYVLDEKKERVAQVKLTVDWEKHEQIIHTFGDIFDDGQMGYDYQTGAAAETTAFLDNLVDHAKSKGFKLSAWVKTCNITGEDRTKLLKEIGFDGGRPEPWGGKIASELSENYKTLPQMEARFRCTDKFE